MTGSKKRAGQQDNPGAAMGPAAEIAALRQRVASLEEEVSDLKGQSFPRIGQIMLEIDHPEADSLDDAAYLQLVLSVIAETMFCEEVPADFGIRSRDAEGDSVLHEACYGGYSRAVRLLIQAGVDINATNEMGETPLHIAAQLQFLDILGMLLAAGADRDRRNAFGYTAREWAVQMGDAGVLALLDQT